MEDSPSLDIKDISLRYRDDLPFVLQNISLHLEAGSKLGIMGRTGSGKSSLMLALFRLIELEAG